MAGHNPGTEPGGQPTEYSISAGEFRAEFSTAGAAMRQLERGGESLTSGFPAGTWPGSMNALLVPWPNRVDAGRFSFRGAEHVLEITEVERSNAIHGFAVDTLFRVAEHAESALTLEAVLGPREGWPWPIATSVTYRLHPADGLRATLVLRNDGEEPAPIAAGVHTYLKAPGTATDDATLDAQLDLLQPLDEERLLPAGEPVLASSLAPFPGKVKLAERNFDHAFLHSEPAEVYRYTLTGADGRALELSCGPEFRWAQIYTSPDRELAVEPMTAPPNALASGQDLRTLEPGEELRLWWALAAH